MTISVTIKHETSNSPWALEAQGVMQNAEGKLSAIPGETPWVLQPGPGVTVTMWKGKQFLLTEVPAHQELQSAP